MLWRVRTAELSVTCAAICSRFRDSATVTRIISSRSVSLNHGPSPQVPASIRPVTPIFTWCSTSRATEGTSTERSAVKGAGVADQTPPEIGLLCMNENVYRWQQPIVIRQLAPEECAILKDMTRLHLRCDTFISERCCTEQVVTPRSPNSPGSSTPIPGQRPSAS
jgi:hypothetical protein